MSVIKRIGEWAYINLKGSDTKLRFPSWMSDEDIVKATKEGKGLDMSTEARMQRAKEQGFDADTTLYHGTQGDIPSFDKSKRGSVTQSRSAKKATWLTDDPTTARSYAEYASTSIPVQRKVDEAYRAEKAGDWDLYDKKLIEAEQLEARLADERLNSQSILPLVSYGEDELIVRDMRGRSFDDFGVSDEIDELLDDAKRSGFKGVRFDNLDDAIGLNRPATHYAIFDPKNIRSINAAFDPTQKESSNLLASAAPTSLAGILGYNALSSDEAEAGVISKGLKKISLYRGMSQEFDPKFDLSRTDAPTGYSTWTDNPELAREYAGKDGYVYKMDLPESDLGSDIIDADGERTLYFNNEKSAGINGVSGDEYLVYTDHEKYTIDKIISIAKKYGIAPAAVTPLMLMNEERLSAANLMQGNPLNQFQLPKSDAIGIPDGWRGNLHDLGMHLKQNYDFPLGGTWFENLGDYMTDLAEGQEKSVGKNFWDSLMAALDVLP